jgi:hypothetical protein
LRNHKEKEKEEMADSVRVRAYTLLNIAKGLKESTGRTSDAEVALCPSLIAISKKTFLTP